MTLRSRLMIGLIATASFPLISFGMDTTSTTTAPRIYTQTEITYIQGLNCDTLSADAKTRCLEIKKAALAQSQTGTTALPKPPEKKHNETEMDHPKPPVSESGTTLQKPPKPPMETGTITGSGADIEREIKWLALALGKLTPEQRLELQKMIREYLTSKWVTLPTPEVKNTDTERKGWDGSIKGKKTATEIQADRKAALEKAKAKREEMRKEYVGHVTLMK